VFYIPTFGDPALVLPLHMRQHGSDELFIAEHEVRRPHRVAVPVAVAPRLGTGSLKPIAGEVFDDAPVLEPADLIELVTERAADAPVGA